jgi:HPt (histidine-containing phosphotransfer) domain-containing protein
MLNPRRLTHAPAAHDGAASASAVDPSSQPSPTLDAAAVAGLRELDPTGKNKLIERVYTAFKSSTARLVPQLLESHRTADVRGMRHVAHTLKSSAASVGGKKLSAICAELETRTRAGISGDVTPQVQALIAEVDNVLKALQRLCEPPP